MRDFWTVVERREVKPIGGDVGLFVVLARDGDASITRRCTVEEFAVFGCGMRALLPLVDATVTVEKEAVT